MPDAEDGSNAAEHARLRPLRPVRPQPLVLDQRASAQVEVEVLAQWDRCADRGADGQEADGERGRGDADGRIGEVRADLERTERARAMPGGNAQAGAKAGTALRSGTGASEQVEPERVAAPGLRGRGDRLLGCLGR